MAQAQILEIKLSRFDAQAWGFRLQGGTDFATPLLVQKVSHHPRHIEHSRPAFCVIYVLIFVHRFH